MLQSIAIYCIVIWVVAALAIIYIETRGLVSRFSYRNKKAAHYLMESDYGAARNLDAH